MERAAMRPGAWLAVAVTGLLLASCAAGFQHRRLHVDDPATDPVATIPDGDPADDQPLYSLVTTCPPHMKASPTLKELYKGNGFDVVDMTATIEMTQQISFANNFREADPTSWAPGNTRINYTVEISPHGGKMPSQLVARLHTGTCFSPLDQDTIYLRQAGNNASDVEAMLNIDADTHTGESTTTKNYLINYDNTESLVVYDGDTMVACCDMIPPFPDFPTEWSATVEANIINQGYTYVQKETYSESQNKVRVDLHSYAADIVMVQDYTARKTTIIYPANTTYPQGVCQERDFIPSMTNFVDDSAGSVFSTKNFLMFEGTGADPNSEPGFEPGHVAVRGIPSEVWFRKIQNKATNSSFDVSFYFPVNEWLVARENYHRMLKQISVVGTMDGEEVNHLYSYINYRPYIAPDGVFDVCAIAPRGQNCNCTGKNVATQAQVDHVLTFDENGEGVSITKLTPSALKANTANNKCPANDKFTDEQKRWYGMWAAVGFAIGIVVAWIGSVCWYHTVVGVRSGDRMGHAKLRERPFIIGRQPSSYM